MTQYLPPNLLALFAPRDPIPFMPQTAELPWEKKHTPYDGIAQFIAAFEELREAPAPVRVETRDERRERKRKERAEQIAYKLEQDLALWDPTNAANVVGDPYKTLFVARINYDSSESKLRREFEAYGPVKRIALVHDKITGKPRGYAFVEYEHERDMHSAYKHADGRKIDGRRVLVDIERGRTIKGWRPRRLGGGLGGTRKGGPDENTKYSGRDEASALAREREEREAERNERGIRSRSRDRSRRRSPRRRRSRSKERRRRSRSKDGVAPRKGRDEEGGDPAGRKRSRRSRSRDRPRRSRSRDRKRRRSRDRRDDNYGDDTAEVKEEQLYEGYGDLEYQAYNGEDEIDEKPNLDEIPGGGGDMGDEYQE